jgi:hypothetical protein
VHPPCAPPPPAYRRACLENHPDKALIGVDDAAEKERIEERFKIIQVKGQARRGQGVQMQWAGRPADCHPES